MERSFRLMLFNDYIIVFLCYGLIGECANSLINCDNPFFICGENGYKDDSCSENNIQNWYFSEIQMQDRKRVGNCKGLIEEKTKPSFKNLEVFAFPIKYYNTPYRPKLCVNISREDLNSTDWLSLEICEDAASSDDHVHIMNITTRQSFCDESSDQPITLLCYSNWLLSTVDRNKNVKVKFSSEESSEIFRATIPNWKECDKPSNHPDSCIFRPFVYSTQTEVHVSSKNYTTRFNVKILRNKEEIVAITNVTLNENLIYKLKEDEQCEECYYEANISKMFNNLSDHDYTGTTDFTDMTTQLSSEFKPKMESHPPYFLLYLIPIILIIVLSIACFILRKDIDLIWEKIGGRSRKNAPTVKFLYCNCSSHEIYKKQLRSFLLFIERYCNIYIVDSTEQIYADNESLLQRGTTDTDYVIFVPMPELKTPDSENESYFQNLQQEFSVVKESKQIIIILPFQGEIDIENFIRPKPEHHIASKLCKVELLKKRKLRLPTIFTLMDDFIPFIQHVHRKYRRRIFQRGRDFLSREKMSEIQQKLEDYNLTNIGFEFLSNNLDAEQLDGSNSLSFVNLNNMSL